MEDDLSNLVRRFWEQEEIHPPDAALTPAEKECEMHFVRTHSRGLDGRYMVRLPLSAPLPDLSGTRFVVERVLKHMELKFKRDTAFHGLYKDFLRQYADLDHLSPPSPEENSTERTTAVCYLSHHGVLREASFSTKLRVVFNGSATLPSGASLNRYLHVGPNLLPALADVLLRWRRHCFVLATDVEKMFHQIEVYPKDRDLQRILWREDPAEEVKEWRLRTVTYGLACAPFLAIRTLRQLAADEEESLPLGAAVLRRDVYMDDILTGADSIEEALSIREQLTKICKAGGFPLKKWSANEATLLTGLPTEDQLQQESRW